MRVSSPSISDSEMLRYRIMEFEDRYRKQVLAMACTLVSLVDLRDAYTGGHSSRVAGYVRSTAVRLGFRDAEVDSVVMAALLHDIKKHPELGWMALKNIDDFKSISLIVLHHHERMDGGGYPGGLKGNEIPLGSRIIAVADSYDALTTDRPYRSARTRAQAIEELLSFEKSQFDSRVLAAFLDSMKK